MRIRLTRKLAAQIDGVNLSDHVVDDIIDLPPRQARLLIAEGWAVVDVPHERRSRVLAFQAAPRREDRDDDVSQAS